MNDANTIINKDNDKIIVSNVIKYHFRKCFKNQNNYNVLQAFPDELIKIIYNYYYLQFMWDAQSNKDDAIGVSENGLSFTSITDGIRYISHKIHSSIFMNEWITNNNCKYYFKFKIHGQPNWHNAIAIGIVNDKYDISHPEGIGYDKNGWSWCIWGARNCYIYQTTYAKMLDFPVENGCEFSFEITVEDGNCVCDLIVNGKDKTTVQFKEIKAPVKIGASVHTKSRSLSLEIIEQKMYYIP